MTVGRLMIDLAGTKLRPEEKEMLQHPFVGGVILFSRNYEEPAQVTELIATIRRCKKAPLLVAIDQEGGRVQRFGAPLSSLPSAASFGKIYDRSPKLAVAQVEETAYLMAFELRELGVDFSFAPVLDLDWQRSEIIGDRAFHANPEIVTELAGGFIRGMARAGMPSVGKHFPGHGWVKEDSHSHIPVDTRDWDTLWHYDLKPFKVLSQGALSAVMPAHIIYSQCDPYPAGFSPFWLKKILRDKIGFKGIIYSDDLSMEGAGTAGGFIDRVEAALNAGCDRVLICNHPTGVEEVLNRSG